MSSPMVSIIIPTHNRAHMVGRAIRSVLAQTFKDFELILVDDCSTDYTEEAARTFHDRRMVYLRHDENQGASAARNTGVRAARGKYIAFLDSDNEWWCNKLELQVAVLEQTPEIGLVYAGWEWVSEKTGEVELRRVPDGRGRVVGLPRWAHNIADDFLVRSEILKETFHNEDLQTYEEYDLFLRLATKCSFRWIPKVLVSCYTHDGPRLSDGDAREKVKVLEYIIREHGWFIRKDAKAWAGVNQILGDFYLTYLGDITAARKCLWQVLIARPLHWKSWLYAVASLYPPMLPQLRRTLRGA